MANNLKIPLWILLWKDGTKSQTDKGKKISRKKCVTGEKKNQHQGAEKEWQKRKNEF